ncbi:MAG: hypothetical protein ACLP1X_02175 [Polyangiaceae bacterium]
MTSQPPIFLTALQVSNEVISNLNETSLGALMDALLHDHAYRCGAAVSEVIVNAEEKAADGGCDAWSPAPPQPDEWFGDAATCWQLKAGTAGQRARLAGEITSPIPADTLRRGGRFVLVASGSTNGTDGERDRLEKLQEEAKAAGLPTGRIHVIGSERLTTWCNQHPAVAARFSGARDGLWLIDRWSAQLPHRAPWQPTPEREAELSKMRAELDFSSNALLHLHIQGHPGVGKSRFALELCRDAPWKGSVVYVRDATDLSVREVIEGAVSRPGVRLVLVADEIQRHQLEPLRDAVDAGEGRVRLVTIGHCRTPDPNRIPTLLLKPLDDEAMRKIVGGWRPSMPREHVAFVARFADGYVRLARLASDAVARNPAIDIRGILNENHIREFLDSMLQGGNRRALHVVAVLRSVGWKDDKEIEGTTIAKELGLDWNEVCASVEDFDSRLGIVPRGGRYRYISPTPLGIHLAVEAWGAYPTALRALADKLPTEEAKAAYYDRLEEIASSPHAQKFAREELAFFFRVTDFADAWAARRWSALSAADPALAAANVVKALSSAPREEKLAINRQARRELVHRLVLLAWNSSSFYDATLALALLGEAENETWANNASREFIGRFELVLGGTSVPYRDRLRVLDELLTLQRPPLDRLVIQALTRVYNQGGFRVEPTSVTPLEKEWYPRTGLEVLECIRASVGRLAAIAESSAPELQADLVKAADGISMLLRDEETRDLVAGYYFAVRKSHPDTREALRRIVADILYRERKYWNQVPKDALAKIEAIHASFEDQSLSARLRQRVGPGSWEKEEDKGALMELARELVADRAALEREWGWLTSGNAGDAWDFGEALAVADANGELDDVLPGMSGRGLDLRTLCGLISKRRELRGPTWFDEWITRAFAGRPEDWPLMFELGWRCGVTVTLAGIISAAVRATDVPEMYTQQLGNGAWPSTLPLEALTELLEGLSGRGHCKAAIAILEHRLKSTPSDLPALEAIAVLVATSTEVIRNGATMTDYYWKEVAFRLAPRHAQAIVAAIFREQADRTSDTWFAEYTTAKEVLWRCVELDPAAVWQAFMPHLSSALEGFHVAIGFPLGLLDRMPIADVLKWVEGQPKERASIVARLVNKSLLNDETLTARVLGQFGDDTTIASEFFSAFVSGSWMGRTSEHWARLAAELERVAQSTKLTKLRRWAAEAARGLRQMQERDAQREEEEEVRGR